MSKLRTKQRRAASRRREWQAEFLQNNPVNSYVGTAEKEWVAQAAAKIVGSVDPQVEQQNAQLHKTYYSSELKYDFKPKKRKEEG